MKIFIGTVFGLLTLSNLLAWLTGDEIDCDDCTECLKELDV